MVQLMDHLGRPVRDLNLNLSPSFRPVIAFPRRDVDIWVNKSMKELGSCRKAICVTTLRLHRTDVHATGFVED